ncbi:MAG: serine/threonine-protein phosphatase [Spirochaetales bacterium]|nr:serine/threonine-protein phosphatase [Spirochaetales bacterium]
MVMIVSGLLAALVLVIFGAHAEASATTRRIGRRTLGLCLAMAAYAAAAALESIRGGPALLSLAADVLRLAGAAAFASLSIGFPAERAAPVARAAIWGAWFVAAALLSALRLVSGVDARILRAAVELAAAAAVLASSVAIILFPDRGLDRDERPRSAVLGMSGIVTALAALVAPFLPTYLSGPVALAAWFVLGASSHYAATTDHVIGPYEALRVILVGAVWTLSVGLPVGVAAWFLVEGLGDRPWIRFAALALLFLLATGPAEFARRRFFSALRGGRRYLKRLEEDLAAIDLDSGRDTVLDALEQALGEAMRFRDFAVLYENDGELDALRCPGGAKPRIDRRDPAIEHLVNLGTTMVSRRRAGDNRNYAIVRSRLLEIFDLLQADVLVIAREGREVVGVFGLGRKSGGSDWGRYDFESLARIYGKLFVFAYYLRNAARAWVIQTVDREIALSDQVIRSVQQNVDRIEHPKADAAFVTRSTRRLGGDFIDFVRVSENRWFFVVGDVAGKGLNASMSMVILKSTIRNILKTEKNFARLVAKTNAFVKKSLPRGSFFAGVFGYIDFAAGNLYFINCGIPVMYLNTPGFASFVEVQGDGKVLGFVRDIAPHIKTRRVAIAPGSTLAIATDGILEATNLRGERFGKERLQRALAEYHSYEAPKAVDLAVKAAYDFGDGDIEDDVTLFILRTKA